MFCNEDGFITEKECVNFIKSTTNTYEANIRPDDNRIKTLFTEFSISNPGYLTEEEFLNFYTVRAQAKTEAVWSNLQIMKYGNDLRH
jgi:Ca2+-binding EF-hand superfamily protein